MIQSSSISQDSENVSNASNPGVVSTNTPASTVDAPHVSAVNTTNVDNNVSNNNLTGERGTSYVMVINRVDEILPGSLSAQINTQGTGLSPNSIVNSNLRGTTEPLQQPL